MVQGSRRSDSVRDKPLALLAAERLKLTADTSYRPGSNDRGASRTSYPPCELWPQFLGTVAVG